MTDQMPQVALLPIVDVEQVEPIKLENKESREQTGTSAIVLKGGDAFLIADAHGDFIQSRREMGLFRHGTRFLRTCNLYLEGSPLVPLSHQVATMSEACHIDLTNVTFLREQQDEVEQGEIHVDRFMELEQDRLVQTLIVTNFHPSAVQFTLTLTLDADFCDQFEVRGASRQQLGTQLPAQKRSDGIILRYQGLDDVERTTHLQCNPPAQLVQADRVDWLLNLPQGYATEIRITINMSESGGKRLMTESAATSWRDVPVPTTSTDNPFFNRFLTRGMQDLMMLSTMTPYGFYPYAGIPWFCCPFGRDGLITTLQFLPWFPQVAQGTLELLAAYQGKKVEPFTDEEPGKILHELRLGEMANCHEIPHIPYYGTVDATPLFLIVLEAYIRWTNDLPLLEKLWPNAEAAAKWLTDYGDKDGDTFIEFHCASEKGLANQGWKDAWDSASFGDGRIAHSPMALCEVQGYAYAAYRAMSNLASKLGKYDQALHWDRTAETLQTNFLDRFWWEQEQVFYMALAARQEPCDIVTSNAGQCLWTGIVPDEQAQKIIRRLMREDMFSGWGIRTLSTQAKRYNPMSYHNGSIWPHDSALVGTGFAQYGAKEEAGRILKSLFDASHYYEGARLPELYCGFARREGYGPTRYPVSCSPQAWAAGAPFILLSSILGLQPDAAHHRLLLKQPILPAWLKTLEIKDLYVGDRRVHLRFVHVDDRTEIVLGKENEVDVRVI